jgi:BTB/POZ domain-containing protein 10
MPHFLMQCVKSKSVTNLAEATADPVLELDAGGNPIPVPAVHGAENDEGAVGGILPPQPCANEPYPELPLPLEETP